MDERQAKIISFYRRNRRMPSYREIMHLTGYKSTSAVHYFIEHLVRTGVVSKDSSGHVVPKDLGGTKLLGLVEAGFPSAAEEELLDVMSFDEYLTPNKESSYILKVKGDSMLDAGIHPGDMVVVERRASYKPGSIVIAMIDGQYTMKYLRRSTDSKESPQTKLTAGKKGSEYYLEPANKEYKPIYPTEDFRVEAVVTAVVRKY